MCFSSVLPVPKSSPKKKTPVKKKSDDAKDKEGGGEKSDGRDLAKVVKNDKLLFNGSGGASLNKAQVEKWVTSGEMDKLEYTFFMGKGRLLVGKSTWNDAARKFIKTVPDLMVREKKVCSDCMTQTVFSS